MLSGLHKNRTLGHGQQVTMQPELPVMNWVLSLSDPPSHKEGMCSNTVTSAGRGVHMVMPEQAPQAQRSHRKKWPRCPWPPLSSSAFSPAQPAPTASWGVPPDQPAKDPRLGLGPDGSTRCADTAPKWTAKPHSLSLGHFPRTAVEQNPLSGQDLGTAPGSHSTWNEN